MVLTIAMEWLLEELFIKSFTGRPKAPWDKFLLEFKFKSETLLNNWYTSVYDKMRTVQPIMLPALLSSPVIKNLKINYRAYL